MDSCATSILRRLIAVIGKFSTAWRSFMFTDEQLEDAQIIAEDLRQGSQIVFNSQAELFQRMVDERDGDTIPRVMALIMCLLPGEAQTRIRFGAH
jgi:hypothetical protein